MTTRFPHRRDIRLPAILVMIAAIAALGYGLSRLPGRGVDGSRIESSQAKADGASGKDFSTLSNANRERRQALSEAQPFAAEIDPKDPNGKDASAIMKNAAARIQAGRYDDALMALDNAHSLLRNYPEAYMLIGRALEGRKDYSTARDFYLAAIDRNPFLADAYWGFATTSEMLNDLESAIGAMRSYLHTEPNPDPNRLRIAQARSAIWEWESRLERGPWGPTKGIPPGFSEAELKRDGRGVGIKIPRPETLRPDGTMDYEIRHQQKYRIFPKP